MTPGALTPARLDDLHRTFHSEHRRLYTYELASAPVELVNLRVTAVGLLPRRASAPVALGGADAGPARAGERGVYLRDRGGVSAPCYDRGRLAPGMTFDGPALVDQPDATSLVLPGFRARVDLAHNMLLERA